MLNAPTDLHRSQQLLQDSTRIMTDAATRIERSSVLIARGETRVVARARAAVTSDETLPGGHRFSRL
jgi:hypothetical protein